MSKTAANGKPIEFLLSIVNNDSDECIYWPYAKMKNGYGAIWYGGKTSYAHRVVLELKKGKAPKGKNEACHNCNNGQKGCVNPNCLRWDTKSNNTLDQLENNTMHLAKLNVETVKEIRADNRSDRELAEIYKVHPKSIQNIKQFKTWNRVTCFVV